VRSTSTRCSRGPERDRVAQRRAVAGQADEALLHHAGEGGEVEAGRRLHVGPGAEDDQADAVACAAGDELARRAAQELGPGLAAHRDITDAA
jgi:hypothetical protein